ncbi:Flp pilus assembly protein CpaB [Caulobacter sp. UNC358MFTsu5.1]|uniref:Flp pilus assembly protein CpaB n=1 Tax=Caulobacter sp. UNC358MFTsu5.1 TaxID=1449049 RepID=UPI0004A6F0CD|nr:Flp pilus assembly protein CpaB [Caulobacter sp. UNC358MFTsu5.1]
MNPLRVMIVLVAAVAAIGLAVVMQKAMGGKPAPAPVVEAAPASKPMTQVLVAKRDLAIGDRLTGGDVAWQPWPSDTVNAAFITNGAAEPAPTKVSAKAAKAVGDAAEMIGGVSPEKAVEGAIVRDPILSGEPITARKIVRGGEGGYLSVVLGPGKRAMAVPITSETAVGGFILPGDRVDVIQTHEQTTVGEGDGGGKQVVAETVIQNVRVLALDQTTAAEKKDAKTIVASTATLEVGPVEAEALSRAKAGGPVTLTLRAYTDLGGPSGAVVSQDSSVVRINRGGQTSSISVRP